MKTREQLLDAIKQTATPDIAILFWFDFVFDKYVNNRMTEEQVIALFTTDVEKGGPGSGNHGHDGRPGKHGGSMGDGAGSAPAPTDDERAEFAELVKDEFLNERQQAVADQIGEEEAKAILRYTVEEQNMSYKTVNPALRTGVSMSPEDKLLVKHVDHGLEQMPIHDGKTYRGIVTPSDYDSSKDYIDQNFKVGQVVRDDAYLSTSKDRVLADTFSNGTYGYGTEGERGIIIEVYSRQGRDISSLAVRQSEKEVLFPRSTRFVVDNVYFDENEGKPVVVLADSDYNSKGKTPPADEFMRALQLSDDIHRDILSKL